MSGKLTFCSGELSDFITNNPYAAIYACRSALSASKSKPAFLSSIPNLRRSTASCARCSSVGSVISVTSLISFWIRWGLNWRRYFGKVRKILTFRLSSVFLSLKWRKSVSQTQISAVKCQRCLRRVLCHYLGLWEHFHSISKNSSRFV